MNIKFFRLNVKISLTDEDLDTSLGFEVIVARAEDSPTTLDMSETLISLTKLMRAVRTEAL
jgi:hypothetical protein